MPVTAARHSIHPGSAYSTTDITVLLLLPVVPAYLFSNVKKGMGMTHLSLLSILMFL